MKNYAFIDSQNLRKSLISLDETMDYRNFRLWLRNKYQMDHALIFFGYVPTNRKLYFYLEQCGFELKFRDVEYNKGRIKGNVDVFLTISALDLISEVNKAYFVTSDGDFYDLAQRFQKLGKFGGII